MASSKSGAPRPVFYSSAAEFTVVLRETFAQACRQDPNDPALKRVSDEVTAAETAGRPGDAEAALRKWYSKRRLSNEK